MNKEMKLVMTLGQLMNILCRATALDCSGCPFKDKYSNLNDIVGFTCSGLSDPEVLEALSKYGVTHLFTEVPTVYTSDKNINHILPTLNAKINCLKEENKRLRKKKDKAEKDFEALKKHNADAEKKLDEYSRRFRESTAIFLKSAPGYILCFERVNVSSAYKNSDGTYTISLWGDSIEHLRDRLNLLEENYTAYTELCRSLSKIATRKDVPNERAYTEHDAG